MVITHINSAGCEVGSAWKVAAGTITGDFIRHGAGINHGYPGLKGRPAHSTELRLPNGVAVRATLGGAIIIEVDNG